MNDNPKTQPPNELKEILARRIAKAGEDDFMVKQLRRQIAAEERELNSLQLFSGHPYILRKKIAIYWISEKKQKVVGESPWVFPSKKTGKHMTEVRIM